MSFDEEIERYRKYKDGLEEKYNQLMNNYKDLVTDLYHDDLKITEWSKNQIVKVLQAFQELIELKREIDTLKNVIYRYSVKDLDEKELPF